MARPPSRRRPAREEESPARRGRTPARKPAGPPPGVLIAGVLLVIGAGVGAMVMAGKEEPAPKPEPIALAPVVKKEEVAAPKAPTKVPPPPLTDAERTYIEGLFRKAEPHMKKFHEYADAGWKLEDEAERNEVWSKAKEEGRTAIQIVSEAMEDYDRFSVERQDAHMKSWNNKLAGWSKDLATKIGKVHK